jgi:hypothetical protein
MVDHERARRQPNKVRITQLRKAPNARDVQQATTINPVLASLAFDANHTIRSKSIVPLTTPMVCEVKNSFIMAPI